MRIFYIIFFFISPLALIAQQTTLMGVVRDTYGEILPLANILILPDSIIAAAGEEGRFTAHMPSGKKQVIITYTGFETLRSTIFNGEDILNIFRDRNNDGNGFMLQVIPLPFRFQTSVRNITGLWRSELITGSALSNL